MDTLQVHGKLVGFMADSQGRGSKGGTPDGRRLLWGTRLIIGKCLQVLYGAQQKHVVGLTQKKIVNPKVNVIIISIFA